MKPVPLVGIDPEHPPLSIVGVVALAGRVVLVIVPNAKLMNVTAAVGDRLPRGPTSLGVEQ